MILRILRRLQICNLRNIRNMHNIRNLLILRCVALRCADYNKSSLTVCDYLLYNAAFDIIMPCILEIHIHKIFVVLY